MRKFFIQLFILIVVFTCGYVLASTYPIKPLISKIENLKSINLPQFAASTESEKGPVSINDLQTDYNNTSTIDKKVHILIVPGHEPDYGGAQFKGEYGMVYERDLNVELGQDLEQFLQNNNNYQVNITRDTKSWNSALTNYFNNDWKAIIAWVDASKKNAPHLSSLGGPPPIIHITDPTNVALRLFGIIKWSNENNIDLMIHIHFNDYQGHRQNVPGKYSGLVIYTPAQQYSNSTTTDAVARAVFKRLTLYNPISNLHLESRGIIDDPELIAIGANNTSTAASMLIEYEYIYEPQLVNPKVRDLALKDLAYQTYLGIQDYFNKNTNVSVSDQYNPSTIYTWNGLGTRKNSDPKDIYALQTALMMDGDYPPVGKTKNDCPHSGIFGSCTESALKTFQDKNQISGEDGTVGPKSFNVLDNIYLGKVS